MGQPLSPPLKLLVERGNAASPVMIMLNSLILYTHTYWHRTCLDTHTATGWSLHHPGSGRGWERAQEQRNETESEHMGSQGPGKCIRFVRCEKMTKEESTQDMVQSLKLTYFYWYVNLTRLPSSETVFELWTACRVSFIGSFLWLPFYCTCSLRCSFWDLKVCCQDVLLPKILPSISQKKKKKDLRMNRKSIGLYWGNLTHMGTHR